MTGLVLPAVFLIGLLIGLTLFMRDLHHRRQRRRRALERGLAHPRHHEYGARAEILRHARHQALRIGRGGRPERAGAGVQGDSSAAGGLSCERSIGFCENR